MIGLSKIGVSLGSVTVDNFVQGNQAGKTNEFISGKIGFEKIRKLGDGESITQMCVKAWEDLETNCPVSLAAIDCVMLCTQTPEHHGIPHGSALIHKALELEKNVACFDISLGCSGYVYGLSIIKSFMEANKLKNGLFFTCDPYTQIIGEEDWNTKLLFGDGATVSYLSADANFEIGPGKFATNGRLGHSIMRKEDAELSMHGSNVFKFSISEVPNQIKSYMAENNLSIDDIDMFLFHQGSRFIVENLQRTLGIHKDKVLFGAQETGNLVSSSIPFLLHQLQSSGQLEEIKRVLLSGFGVGLSWATTTLTNKNGEN